RYRVDLQIRMVSSRRTLHEEMKFNWTFLQHNQWRTIQINKDASDRLDVFRFPLYPVSFIDGYEYPCPLFIQVYELVPLLGYSAAGMTWNYPSLLLIIEPLPMNGSILASSKKLNKLFDLYFIYF